MPARVLRYRHSWLRFADSLRRALHSTPAAGTQMADDEAVFALQCEESAARMEFQAMMEAWASQS